MESQLCEKIKVDFEFPGYVVWRSRVNAVIAIVALISSGLFWGCECSHHNLVEFHRELETIKVGENLLEIEKRFGLQEPSGRRLPSSLYPYYKFRYHLEQGEHQYNVYLSAGRIGEDVMGDWDSSQFEFVGDLAYSRRIGPAVLDPQ